MTSRNVDLDKLRVALRRMSRGSLLMIAERAIEIVPKAKLQALVGDMVRLDDLAEGRHGAGPLLDEVRKFHAAGLAGEYYESFNVNSKNFMDKSDGTEAFIAEFDRLLTKCIRAATKRPQGRVREAFELLFALIRQIDENPDSVVFFADEAGSWQVGVDWRAALPAYFPCLATSSGEEFVREVDRTITDFAPYDRPKHLAARLRIPRLVLRRVRHRDAGAIDQLHRSTTPAPTRVGMSTQQPARLPRQRCDHLNRQPLPGPAVRPGAHALGRQPFHRALRRPSVHRPLARAILLSSCPPVRPVVGPGTGARPGPRMAWGAAGGEV
jgi:hypothetical protein